MIIGVVSVLSLLAVLAAIMLLFMRRSSQRQRRDSKFVVDPEVGLSPDEECLGVPGHPGTATPPGRDTTSKPTRQLVELEYQARVLQDEIAALKRTNCSKSEFAKGYIDISQSEKLAALSSRAGMKTTNWEPESAEDAPPCYSTV
ncbi:hypothetical protein B0H11DRAFT_1999201 [Mycena galericulata]|nr:hypothetical protein B0H11DRAFT_1999201 [Mycena galericulata]